MSAADDNVSIASRSGSPAGDDRSSDGDKAGGPATGGIDAIHQIQAARRAAFAMRSLGSRSGASALAVCRPVQQSREVPKAAQSIASAHAPSADGAAIAHERSRNGRTAQPAPERVARSAGRSAVFGWLRASVLFVVGLALATGLIWLSFVFAYRFADPPVSSLMIIRMVQGEPIEKTWRPLGSISPHLVRSVIASEDARFCRHAGVDWQAIDAAIEQAEEEGGKPRGASTISMQTVKNLLLWPQQHYVRKALEIPLAYAADFWWGKRRMLEIYLNVAEWGPGIYGAEAAAQYHFRRPASDLTAYQSALLAASLPGPLSRRPSRPSPSLIRIARRIEARAAALGSAGSCIGRRP